MINDILIIDSDQTMLKTLTGLLNGQGGFLNVHAVTDGKQALEVLQKIPVRIVITAIRVYNIDGLELVARISKGYPFIKIIVMTNNAWPLLRAKISKFPSTVYLDQTHDISMLTNRVFTELQIDYGGRVRGINLSSFLQMMELESRTCTLKITSKDKTGYLWLKNGQLIAAKSKNSTGKEAALKIIAWKNVFIDIDYTPQKVECEISLPLMMLILESGQMDDEKRSSSKNSRKHDRYELLVALDYNIDNIRRHCSLRDISLGGAYIETDQEMEMGDSVTLTLTSPSLNSTCTIDTEVVRKDDQGVGILFHLRSLQQKHMIQTMIRGSISTTDSPEVAVTQPIDKL